MRWEMRSMKSRIFICGVLLLTVLTCISLWSCSKESEGAESAESETWATTEKSYEDMDISAYVTGVSYKGVKYTLDSEELSKEQVLWDAMLRNAQVTAYPEDMVEYFFSQTKAAYMYLVDGDEEAYLMLLESRGTDESKMREEAREMVKKDLVFWYIVQAEGITVTEEEKQTHFDKYVDKFVSDYGYSRDYVKSDMADEIYESMLYDKTLEYLFSVNTFEYVKVSETAGN